MTDTPETELSTELDVTETLDYGIIPTDKDGADFVLDIEPYSEEQRRECLTIYTLDSGYSVPRTLEIIKERYTDVWDRIPTNKTLYRWVSSANKFVMKRGLIPLTHGVLNQAMTDPEGMMRDKLTAVKMIQEQVEGRPTQRVEGELNLNIVDYNALMKPKNERKPADGKWMDAPPPESTDPQ